MAANSISRDEQQPESRLRAIDGVTVYARWDESGTPSILDAIGTDEANITAIADCLWRLGFGVMRRRTARSGKIYYMFKGMWAGPGDPPADPLADIKVLSPGGK